MQTLSSCPKLLRAKERLDRVKKHKRRREHLPRAYLNLRDRDLWMESHCSRFRKTSDPSVRNILESRITHHSLDRWTIALDDERIIQVGGLSTLLRVYGEGLCQSWVLQR